MHKTNSTEWPWHLLTMMANASRKGNCSQFIWKGVIKVREMRRLHLWDVRSEFLLPLCADRGILGSKNFSYLEIWGSLQNDRNFFHTHTIHIYIYTRKNGSEFFFNVNKLRPGQIFTTFGSKVSCSCNRQPFHRHFHPFVRRQFTPTPMVFSGLQV